MFFVEHMSSIYSYEYKLGYNASKIKKNINVTFRNLIDIITCLFQRKTNLFIITDQLRIPVEKHPQTTSSRIFRSY